MILARLYPIRVQSRVRRPISLCVVAGWPGAAARLTHGTRQYVRIRRADLASRATVTGSRRPDLAAERGLKLDHRGLRQTDLGRRFEPVVPKRLRMGIDHLRRHRPDDGA
jgi:hypothetical protein